MPADPAIQPPPTRRWLAHPVLSSLLAASWLLLSGGLGATDWLGAALVGLFVPRLLDGFLPRGGPVRLAPALALLPRVLWDIVAANVAVARLVLGPAARLRSAWVRVPLSATHPRAVALLATIITTTPGTVSCVIDERRREILVHALDCDDAAAMAADIKRRYEAPLIDIFEPGARTDRRPAATGKRT